MNEQSPLIFADESKKLVFEDLQPPLVFADESKKMIFDIDAPSQLGFPYTFPYLLS